MLSFEENKVSHLREAMSDALMLICQNSVAFTKEVSMKAMISLTIDNQHNCIVDFSKILCKEPMRSLHGGQSTKSKNACNKVVSNEIPGRIGGRATAQELKDESDKTSSKSRNTSQKQMPPLLSFDKQLVKSKEKDDHLRSTEIAIDKTERTSRSPLVQNTKIEANNKKCSDQTNSVHAKNSTSDYHVESQPFTETEDSGGVDSNSEVYEMETEDTEDVSDSLSNVESQTDGNRTVATKSDHAVGEIIEVHPSQHFYSEGQISVVHVGEGQVTEGQVVEGSISAGQINVEEVAEGDLIEGEVTELEVVEEAVQVQQHQYQPLKHEENVQGTAGRTLILDTPSQYHHEQYSGQEPAEEVIMADDQVLVLTSMESELNNLKPGKDEAQIAYFTPLSFSFFLFF